MSRTIRKEGLPLYQRLYAIVRCVPAGKVVTYGQIARLAGCCTPRMAGYAMAALPSDTPVPWHRVINSRGMISPRSGDDCQIQRFLLETEGVEFSENKVDLEKYGWRSDHFDMQAGSLPPGHSRRRVPYSSISPPLTTRSIPPRRWNGTSRKPGSKS